MSDLVPGSVVHRYRIERQIGRGGMGAVYEAVNGETGEGVAIKAMHAQIAGNAIARKRFFREARAAMALPHPNIVKIHEVFEHAGTPMLAMELLDGESLEDLLAREGKLPLDRFARILVYVTSALGTAHAMGIVHRDLKPENIFLTRSAVGVKVIDFGIAKLTATDGAAAETAALTSTGALVGTPYYMSPEQAFGEKKVDQRSDVWSLGIILYRGLSGVLPTHGASFGDIFRRVASADFMPIEHLVPGLPADVADLVRRMLSRQDEDRPWDLCEVHAVLERYAQATAPSFAAAVLPVWDEPSAASGSGSIASPATSPGAGFPGSAPTPGALRFAPPTALSTGRTPQGTVVMEARPPTGSLNQAILGAPVGGGTSAVTARGTRPGGLLVAIVAVVMAVGALVLWKMSG